MMKWLEGWLIFTLTGSINEGWRKEKMRMSTGRKVRAKIWM